MARPSSQADQEQIKYLEDAKARVQEHGYRMNRATDTDSVPDAIHHAREMIAELRTSKLSPQNYYDLYITVTGQLRDLSECFERLEDGNSNFSILKMYEQVQHTDKIIPRLYLLVTVAGVFIKSGQAAAKDILFDLVELCRGVQHPMRGLFLRHYLSQMSRDKLPDEGSSGPDGDVKDSIEFILQNFGEMNKLWVRMQHQGAFRTMSRREMERKNLRQLVGTNLVRLSEMRGVNLNTYKTMVLPRILEQVVNCKDVIAQEYLMDCVIQVFPDEFHLANLETFLSTCSQLQENVNVKDILIVLMNRLANFARDEPENVQGTEIEMFPLFHRYSSQIIESKADMKLHDILALQVALVNFASRCYPDRLQYINHVHEFSISSIVKTGVETIEDESTFAEAIPHVVSLLSLPLETISLRILELDNYDRLLQTLGPVHRKRVAVAITVHAAKSPTPISTVEEAVSLLTYLSPLIVEEVKVDDQNRFEFETEQHAVAQLFQLLHSDNIDVHFEMYGVARKFFGRGGRHRIEFTLPPLILNSLQLAERAFAAGESRRAKQFYGFVVETIGAMRDQGYPEIALRLFLVAGQSASKCNFEAIAYEFVAQSISTYEDSITDSKQQYASVVYMAGALQQMTGFSADNYDTLISKCTQHSAKLMKKVDGCRAVYMCSHLFWAGSDEDPVHRDEKKVLACLKRSLKIANSCMGKQLPMFVEIFNKYLYFFERECPSITAKYLMGLVELIREHMRLAEAQAATSQDAMDAFQWTQRHYLNTIEHIKQKMAGEGGERYMAILPAEESGAAPPQDTAAAGGEEAE